MRTFERGDVIKVPFPYTDRATRQSRPAVVVSTAQLQELHRFHRWNRRHGWPDSSQEAPGVERHTQGGDASVEARRPESDGKKADNPHRGRRQGDPCDLRQRRQVFAMRGLPLQV